MNAGKLLTQPILLLLSGGLLWLAASGFRRPEWRPMLRVPAAVLTALWLFALPITSDVLEASLEVPAAPQSFVPEVIDVPGGGYSYRSREMTLLSPDSVLRVVAAVRWWKRHPQARLVMSGGSEEPDVPGLEMSTAMAELALAQGVPRSQLFFETRSLNTRQHPDELLRFPFVTPRTRIGVATSPWHLRRALHVFRRRFAQVEGIPSGEEKVPGPLLVRWIPSADGLQSSTRMLQEWIGLAWYMVRDATG